MVDDPHVILALVNRPTLSAPLAHASTVPIKGLAGIDRIAHARPVCAGASRETVGTSAVVVLCGVLGKERIVAGAVDNDHAGRVVDGVVGAGCRICRIIDLARRSITNVIICGERMIDVINAIASISNGAGF